MIIINKTPNLGLAKSDFTFDTGRQKPIRETMNELMGEHTVSNMDIIDEAYGELKTMLEELETTAGIPQFIDGGLFSDPITTTLIDCGNFKD